MSEVSAFGPGPDEDSGGRDAELGGTYGAAQQRFRVQPGKAASKAAVSSGVANPL
jgi:hypothetical protein